MATTLTANPIIIASQATSAQLTQSLRLLKIRWVGRTTVDHVATLKDRNGNKIWESKAVDIGTATNILAEDPESDFNDFPLNGLFVDDLDSGELWVYVREQPPYKTT